MHVSKLNDSIVSLSLAEDEMAPLWSRVYLRVHEIRSLRSPERFRSACLITDWLIYCHLPGHIRCSVKRVVLSIYFYWKPTGSLAMGKTEQFRHFFLLSGILKSPEDSETGQRSWALKQLWIMCSVRAEREREFLTQGQIVLKGGVILLANKLTFISLIGGC